MGAAAFDRLQHFTDGHHGDGAEQTGEHDHRGGIVQHGDEHTAAEKRTGHTAQADQAEDKTLDQGESYVGWR